MESFCLDRIEVKSIHIQVAKACNMAKPKVKQVQDIYFFLGFSDDQSDLYFLLWLWIIELSIGEKNIY